MKKIIVTLILLLFPIFMFSENIYLLDFKLKQTHFTLSLSTMLKDEMNTAEITMETTKKFYDSVSIGDNLVDKSFRWGKLLYEWLNW